MGAWLEELITRGVPLNLFLLLYLPDSQTPPLSCAPQDYDAWTHHSLVAMESRNSLSEWSKIQSSSFKLICLFFVMIEKWALASANSNSAKKKKPAKKEHCPPLCERPEVNRVINYPATPSWWLHSTQAYWISAKKKQRCLPLCYSANAYHVFSNLLQCITTQQVEPHSCEDGKVTV